MGGGDPRDFGAGVAPAGWLRSCNLVVGEC